MAVDGYELLQAIGRPVQGIGTLPKGITVCFLFCFYSISQSIPTSKHLEAFFDFSCHTNSLFLTLLYLV